MIWSIRVLRRNSGSKPLTSFTAHARLFRYNLCYRVRLSFCAWDARRRVEAHPIRPYCVQDILRKNNTFLAAFWLLSSSTKVSEKKVWEPHLGPKTYHSAGSDREEENFVLDIHGDLPTTLLRLGAIAHASQRTHVQGRMTGDKY